MVEFWIVVSQKRPSVPRAGTPVRKSSLIGVDFVKRCGTEVEALNEAILFSRKNPDGIYIVMHTVAAFGVKEPEPVQLNIEKVTVPIPPDPLRDEDEDDWEEEVIDADTYP